jgi:hypothetical protein
MRFIIKYAYLIAYYEYMIASVLTAITAILAAVNGYSNTALALSFATMFSGLAGVFFELSYKQEEISNVKYEPHN